MDPGRGGVDPRGASSDPVYRALDPICEDHDLRGNAPDPICGDSDPICAVLDPRVVNSTNRVETWDPWVGSVDPGSGASRNGWRALANDRAGAERDRPRSYRLRKTR